MRLPESQAACGSLKQSQEAAALAGCGCGAVPVSEKCGVLALLCLMPPPLLCVPTAARVMGTPHNCETRELCFFSSAWRGVGTGRKGGLEKILKMEKHVCLPGRGPWELMPALP